jgi:hypothetical protein
MRGCSKKSPPVKKGALANNKYSWHLDLGLRNKGYITYNEMLKYAMSLKL